MAKITIDFLKERGACLDEQAEFMELFPSGEAEVTEENVLANIPSFDWDWAGDYLLTGEYRKRFFAEDKRLCEEHSRLFNAYYVQEELPARLKQLRESSNSLIREKALIFARLFNEEREHVIIDEKTAKITIDQLIDTGACSDERVLFISLFPSGEVKVTEETALMYAHHFDWEWAGKHLLRSMETRKQFRDENYMLTQRCTGGSISHNEHAEHLARLFARLYVLG